MARSVPGSDGVELTVEDSGGGHEDRLPIVLLHGLTATRDYVVLGSTRLEEAGHRVVRYDARAHGDSSGGPEYTYPALEADLVAIMDALEVERAIIAGMSMGAHTALRYAISHPERVAALAILTPGFDPDRFLEPNNLRMWRTWSEAMRADGVQGFIEHYRFPEQRSDRALRALKAVLRNRLRRHRDLDALADCMDGIARSPAFETLDELTAIQAPSVLLGSRDEYDLDHPFDLARRYAAVLGCDIVVEPEGERPLMFRGDAIVDVILQADALASGARASAS